MLRAIVIALTALAVVPGVACADTVDLALSATAVEFGASLTATGQLTPPTPDVDVAVAVADQQVGVARTGADGRYELTFDAAHGGDVTARLTDGTTSTPIALVVQPRITAKVRGASAFLGARILIRIQPRTWSGVITGRTLLAGETIGRIRRVRVFAGRGTLVTDTPGVGRMTFELTAPPVDRLAGRSLTIRQRVRGRRISIGSTGPDVRQVLRRLEALAIHTPGVSSTLSDNAADSVMAFQKAYRLPRTYVFDDDDWRRLMTARTIRPRYRNPRKHIEIDKGRQILLLVNRGKVTGVVAVSTGATGNTPPGRWSILWKAPQTGTWLGSATLWWTLTFHGGFAIHGFDPVPPYPASHGCTREPIWASEWVYDQSPVGETVYVHE